MTFKSKEEIRKEVNRIWEYYYGTGYAMFLLCFLLWLMGYTMGLSTPRSYEFVIGQIWVGFSVCAVLLIVYFMVGIIEAYGYKKRIKVEKCS